MEFNPSIPPPNMVPPHGDLMGMMQNAAHPHAPLPHTAPHTAPHHGPQHPHAPHHAQQGAQQPGGGSGGGSGGGGGQAQQQQQQQPGMDFPPAAAMYGHHHPTAHHAAGPHHAPVPAAPAAEFVEIKNLMVDGGDRFQPSAVVFDPNEELLWSGNNGGHVTSYYGLDMQKYTSFQVHDNADIRQLLSIDANIYALCSDSLCCWSKLGIPQYIYVGDAVVNLQCMLQTSPTSLLIGGHQPGVIELDLVKKQEIRTVNIEEPGCAILRHSNHFICAGDTSGKVVLRDRQSLKAVHTLQAHNGTLSDFDVHSNQLVTCGFGNRMGSLSVDRFLMVYDLRMMRAMAPLQMPIDPMWLRFVPTYSNRICVVSQMGQFQVIEQGAMTANSMLTYQVQGAPIASFDISSSCQSMAFGDSAGFLHLFTTQDELPVFNSYSQPTEFAPVEPPPHSIAFNDNITPYSIIPMQYPTGERLASDWPEEMCRNVYRRAPKIDPEVVRTMKMVQQVGYAPNPGGMKRNQMPYKGHSHEGGKNRGDNKSNVPESPVGRGEDPFVKVPKRYQKVEIKYSKLGVEDFDFRFYNKTNFAGLETHIPNAYCNAMLQVLYFIEPFRCTLLNHLCEKEFCLSCELGFLFFMLDNQKGKTCQASNFLRAFRTIPEASALSLVLGDAEESMGKANLPRLIQNWSRFIMQQVHSELVEADRKNEGGDKKQQEVKSEPEVKAPESEGQKEGGEGDEGKQRYSTTDHADSIVKKLFGSELENRFKCRCGEVQSRKMTSMIVDLQYPDVLQGSTKAQGPQQFPFSQIVERSMSLDQPTQAWCNKCAKYQPHLQSKIIKSLPDVLAMNCHLENSRDFEFWKVQEELLKKREDVDPAVILANAMTASRSHIKMCRYGNGCKRADCKFRHEKDSQELSKVEMDKLIDEWAMDVSWLPFGLRVELTPEGKVNVQNIPDEDMIPEQWVGEENVVYYQLLATTAHIRDPKTGGNLVSNVFVGEKYHQRKERVTCTQWYLFNDFSITPLDKKEEAVHFSLDWKVPCNVFFIRKDINKRHIIPVTNPLTPSVLQSNKPLVEPERQKNTTFRPLMEEEQPSASTVVGLDAEFVTLNQEEAELRSDGTRSMLKPSQLSVARISCVRGDGSNKGEPFIDDYINTQEQVVDYLTQFSGIKPGDLDASISSKHLTTLKSTYIKLRHLVDAGATFVGHGLKKDFRVINLNVPKNQVIDTVELFHLPRSRMISLKFLAWYFLGSTIQSESHDSIEDARTALQLYEKYKEMKEDDSMRAKLKEMYEKGYKLKWKIPENDADAETQLAGAMEDMSMKEDEDSSTIQDLM